MEDTNENRNMHNEIGWATPCDVAILVFLSDCVDRRKNSYAIQTPTTISENTGYSKNHVGNRCRTLVDRGVVEKVDRGKYRLSEDGASLLNGGLEG